MARGRTRRAASGGGNFPHTAGNTAGYNVQVQIRRLIIDWVSTNKKTDPSVFHTVDWRLTAQRAAGADQRLRVDPGG